MAEFNLELCKRNAVLVYSEQTNFQGPLCVVFKKIIWNLDYQVKSNCLCGSVSCCLLCYVLVQMKTHVQV